MKMVKMLLVILVLGAVIAVLPGCNSNTEDDAAGIQVTPVIRGNLTLEISAAGNLALAHTEDMIVDLFYPTGTKGTIGEVLVEEGDSVIGGQVLVTIDKKEWDDQMSALEDLVTSKERALVQAQINVKTAEMNLRNAHDMVSTKEVAVLTAKVSLQQAETTLATSISAVDYQETLAALRKARSWYDYITTTYKTIAINADDYTLVFENAKERLQVAQTNYDNALSGYNAQEVTLKKNQVKAAELNLQIAENDLLDAEDDIEAKELSLTLSEGNLQDAEKALEDAKTGLAEALEKNYEIVAPFDGFITQVNVEGGDEVLNGTIVAQIADPDRFEADILVSEMDIPQVKVGGQAIVTVDALPGTILTATVTHIAPTATISSGVVNYDVRVEVQAPGANPFGQFGNTPDSTNSTMGEFTPPEGFEIPEGSEFPDFSGGQTGGRLPSMDMQDIELKEGFTVTVSITVASRTDVLLVPNGAVITRGTQSYVQVIKDSGEAEERAVTAGISNWQYTEITEGLEEGEQVNVMLNLAPDSGSPQGGMIFMGGGR